MSKIQDMIEKISKSPKLIEKLRNTQSIEELYEICKKVDFNITPEEIEKGLQKLIAKTISNGPVEICDGELEMIAGGRMDFNKFKASAVTALVILGGMSATPALTQVSAHAAPITNASVEIKEKTQDALNLEFLSAVSAKNLEKCEELLKRGANINIKNKEGETPLMCASSMLDIPMINLLLKNGADPNLQDKNEKTALTRCIHKLEENASNTNTEEKSFTAMKLFLRRSGRNRCSAQNSRAALLEAFFKDRYDLAELLMEYSCMGIEKKGLLFDIFKSFPSSKGLKAIEFLLRKGFSFYINDKDGQGKTLLMCAVDDKKFDYIDLLLKYYADVNIQDNQGQTPLMSAVSQNNIEIAKTLSNKGAKINLKDNKGASAYTRAVVGENSKMKRFLLSRGAFTDKDNMVLIALDVILHRASSRLKLEKPELLAIGLWATSQSKDANMVKQLMFFDVDINVPDKFGKNALIYAIESPNACKEEIAEFLIDKGINLNAKDNEGKTPLMYAVENSPEIAELLLKKGADVNAKDNEGQTALMHCFKKNQFNKIEALVKNGANINLQNNEGWTALMYASICYTDNKDALLRSFKFLLDNGAKIDMENNMGQTALYQAASYMNEEIVEELLNRGAKVNIKDKAGVSIFDLNKGGRIKKVLEAAAKNQGVKIRK